MSSSDISREEIALLNSTRDVMIHGHGRVIVEIRDGKIQMIENTKKTKIS